MTFATCIILQAASSAEAAANIRACNLLCPGMLIHSPCAPTRGRRSGFPRSRKLGRETVCLELALARSSRQVFFGSGRTGCRCSSGEGAGTARSGDARKTGRLRSIFCGVQGKKTSIRSKGQEEGRNSGERCRQRRCMQNDACSGAWAVRFAVCGCNFFASCLCSSHSPARCGGE